MDIAHIPSDLWLTIWNHLPTDVLTSLAGSGTESLGERLHSLLDRSWPVPVGATAWLQAWADTWANAVAVPDFADVVHGWREGLTHWGSSWHLGDTFGALLAQAGRPQQFDQNILADLSRAWNNFIKSGQAAALGIGLFIGYMFRVFTSSG